jgi:hypothetical protein
VFHPSERRVEYHTFNKRGEPQVSSGFEAASQLQLCPTCSQKARPIAIVGNKTVREVKRVETGFTQETSNRSSGKRNR